MSDRPKLTADGIMLHEVAKASPLLRSMAHPDLRKQWEWLDRQKSVTLRGLS